MIRFEQELIEFFGTKDSVTLAYLFGSTVRGDANQLSDVDIAVKFDESLPKKDVFDAELNLISELTGILKTDKVDLIVMNDAPLLLNYNIIKNGKILKSDESIRIQFETMILSTYLDEKHYIEQHTSNILNRVAQSGFA